MLLPVLLTCFLCAVAAQSEAPVAKWPSQFRVGFNETTKIIWTRKTTGVMWYDAATGTEVVERLDGNGDRYCGSIHPLTHTPCRHVVVNSNRYLIFPDLDECCLCCTAAQGCGILDPNWLSDAEYQGTEVKQSVSAYKFSKPGLQKNYYWTTADDAQLPVELDQVPNDLMTFNLDTFTAIPAIDPALLEIPADCHTRCPISSVCTLAANHKSDVAAAK